MREKTIIIFHCEFSQRRGPMLYSILRGMDRELNTDIYPKLCYPEIYILQDGFSRFSQLYPAHCLGRYIKMNDNMTA